MGRAADSERIKLKAMFFNNMGVAAAAAGFAIPVFAFMSHEKKPFATYSDSWAASLRRILQNLTSSLIRSERWSSSVAWLCSFGRAPTTCLKSWRD